MPRRRRGTRHAAPVDHTVANVRRELQAAGDPARRRAIVDKYARKHRNGTVMRCTPGRYEETPRSVDKVIYDSREAAEAARRELERLSTSVKHEIYECHRSKTGHLHLRKARFTR